MRKLTNLLLIAVAFSFLFTGLIACKRATGPGKSSSLSAVVAGRQIRASIDSEATIQPEKDAAVISFTGHQVRVERTRLLLDGEVVAA